MRNYLEHKEYKGAVQYSADDKCFFGQIIGINDLVTFEGQTVDELEASFIEAVTDYLETCKELGKEPQKEYKGTFNIRTTPNIHRRLVDIAQRNNQKLNNLINGIFEEYITTH